MQVPARRLLLLAALVSVVAGCDRKPTFQVKFEPMYRAAKTIQASTGIGLSYQQLGEALQGLATEVSIAADRSETSDELPVTDGKFADGAIQVIWKVASGHVDKATALYFQRASSQ